jgi:hypothetical protein
MMMLYVAASQVSVQLIAFMIIQEAGISQDDRGRSPTVLTVEEKQKLSFSLAVTVPKLCTELGKR